MLRFAARRAPFLLLATLLFVGSVRAQSSRVVTLPDSTLSARVGLQIPTLPLELDAMPGSGLPTLEYEQNVSPKLGVGFDFGFLGAYLTFLNLEPQEARDKYGETKFYDFQVHSYFSHFGLDLYYEDFRGYYLDNSDAKFSRDGAAGGIIRRPDLNSFFVGGNLLYFFHPERMSLTATGSNTALQVASGGTWILALTYAEQSVRSDATLAPAGFETSYGRLGNLTRGRFKTAGAGGGYGYNWVFAPNWYVHGSILASVGPQYQNFETRDYGLRQSWEPAAKANGRFALGYNGQRYFSGLQVLVDSTLASEDDRSLTVTASQATLFFGVRTDLGFAL